MLCAAVAAAAAAAFISSSSKQASIDEHIQLDSSVARKLKLQRE